MRVLFVGGVSRLERALERLGDELGIAVEVHAGDVRGRHGAELEARIGRSDHVVVVTSTNSHGGMWLAKRHAHRCGAAVWIVRSFGLTRARLLLEELARTGALARCA